MEKDNIIKVFEVLAGRIAELEDEKLILNYQISSLKEKVEKAESERRAAQEAQGQHIKA